MKKSGASFARGASKQDYRTPADFMAAVTARFGPISFDLAALAENTQHKNFFSIRDNSLVQDWHKLHGLLWLNPPFDNITPWAKKCAEERERGARIAFLVPASVGSNWFADYVFPNAFTWALTGRLCFDGIAPYPKDCQLSLFTPEGTTGFNVWRWK